MMETTDLVPTATIAAVCQAYHDSVTDVQEAFRLLHQTDKRIKTVLVNEYPHFLPDQWYLHDSDAEQCVKRLRREGWWYIYRQTRVWEICSIKQRETLEKEARQGELPELTELNVLAFLQKLGDSLPDMFQQALKEVFDWLRPQRYWGAEYKTNNKFAIGKKVILGFCVDQRWGGHYDVYYAKKQHLQALDNVFHLLDGKGVSRYPNDLVTAIDTAGNRGGQECQTPYFQCKWFRNGNLHVTFKRLDLVKEINKRAGASGLATYEPTGAEIVPADRGAGGNDDGDSATEQAGEMVAGTDSEIGAGAAAGPDDAAAAGPDVPSAQVPGTRAA